MPKLCVGKGWSLPPALEREGREGGGVIVWAHRIWWKVQIHCNGARSWLEVKANSYSGALELPGEEGGRHATRVHAARRKWMKVQKLLIISKYIKSTSRRSSGPLTPRDTNTENTLPLFLTDRRQGALQSSTTSQCQAHATSLLP